MHNDDFQAEIAKFKTASFLQKLQLPLTAADEIELLQTTAEALFYFFSNQHAKISGHHIASVNKLMEAAQGKASEFMAPVTELTSIEAAQSDALTVDKAHLAQLIAECREENFAINLLEAALANDFSLISPFSGNKAYCQESYEVGGELTCLRFTDGNRCFFLIQFVSSADALYFPEQNIVVSLAHVQGAHVTQLQNKLLGLFPSVVEYAKSVNAFSGVIACHSRPGHFYYEVWPVLIEISNRPELYEQIPCLIMRKDQDFNDMKLLFENSRTLILESRQIDDMSLHENKWFMHIGTNRQRHLHNFYYEVTDQILVNKVLNAPTETALAKVKQVQGCYPLVWVGVEGQKRCWLEQIEGYAYILNQLAIRYPKLGVVIDGWTLPFTPSEYSIREVDKDLQVAAQIIELLDPAIKHVLVIGENSNTKIFVGNKVDFFISNFATGSMHISRILGKPGFCHLSGELASVSLRFGVQIHPNNHVYLLPKKYVVDENQIGPSFAENVKKLVFSAASLVGLKKPQSQSPQKHFGSLSYSIDKKAFYQFIEQRLDKVLANRKNRKLRFFIETSFSIHSDIRQYLKIAAQGNVIQVFPGLKFPKTIEDLRGFSKSYLCENIIYSAYKFGSHKALELPAHYMVWFCDPLQRVKFHAMQMAKNAAAKNQPADMNHILTVGHKVLDNHYTRIVSGLDAPFGKCTEAMLDKAIGNLKRRFIFIGINEQQARSFDRLCELMDWDRSLFPNELPHKFQVDETLFSDENLQKAEELVHYDRLLYQAALDMLADK